MPSSGTELSTQRFALRILGWTALGLSVLFAAEAAIDVSRSGISWGDLQASSNQGKALATTVSRAYNNLLAMVLAFVSLAIPLTANMYTPKLVEIFFSDRVNLAGLVFFAVMAAHAVFAQWLMYDQWAPAVAILALLVSGVLGFVVVIPYYLYVIDFLNPTTIIERVRDRVAAQYEHVGDPARVAARQRALHERILQLGNVILRAIDRADRDVAIEAISALEHALFSYAGPKRLAEQRWFEVSKELFPGLSREAVAFLHRERIWVEHRFLSQLHLAYVAALARMPDAISAISRVNRKIAEAARDAGDGPALDLSIRYFNTFVRTAITRRDLHAVFDVFHQYRLLAEELLPTNPDRTRLVARHMRYYGDLARSQEMSFVHELAAAEVAVLVEKANDAQSPAAGGLLDELVAFHCGDATPRLAKAEAVLCAYFSGAGRHEEALRMRALLETQPRPLLEIARRDIAATDDPMFWEVTDRQTNLDYVEPGRREKVVALLDELIRAS